VSLSIGIVGLPNVGKSTLFTALTRKTGVTANYPFTTIEPNVGVVAVPDERLARLAELVSPERIVPASVEFVDIAGLVAGANEGEGLGNKFLANIRETDAICEVVRYFTDPDVIHVDGRVDPAGDVETIRTELILADLGTMEKAIPRLEREAKRDKALIAKFDLARRVETWMEGGHRAARMDMTRKERELLRDLHLLTMKPMLYVANVDEDAVGTPLDPIDGVTPIRICAKVEADLAELDPAEAKEYMSELGMSEPGLDTLIHEAYRLLGSAASSRPR
jgi:GTP-binding protein YchF